MTKQPKQPVSIKRTDYLETLAKGLSLLRLFDKDVTNLSTQDVAERLGLSRAAARRFLITLEYLGYLARENRTFRLTPEILTLGYSYFASLDLLGIARPIMKSLVETVDEFCGLAIMHKDEAISLGGVVSQKTFGTQLRAGTVIPAYPTAAGRVLLAGFSDNELDSFLKRVNLKKLTPYTTVDKNRLKLEVQKVRKSGFSIVCNELLYGACGLAVPILDRDSKTIAALNLSLQHGTDRKSMLKDYLPLLMQTAEEINSALQSL